MKTLATTGLETADLSAFSRFGGAIGPKLSTDVPGDWSRYSLQVHGYLTFVTGDQLFIDLGGRDEIVFGFHYKGLGNTTMIFGLEQSPGGILENQGFIEHTAAGTLRVFRGNPIASTRTLLQESVKQLNHNKWVWISGWFKCANSGGRWVVYVDEELFIDFTGDTQDHASSNLFYSFELHGYNNAPDYRIDDIWIVDPETDGIDRLPEIGIAYLPVVGAGDVTQLNASPATAARWYLPSGGSVGTSVTPDSLWDRGATGRFVAPLVPNKTSTAMTTKNYSSSTAAWAAGDDILIAQFISDPIGAQTISGTIKGQIRTRESTTTHDARGQIVVKVVTGGGSLRGVLYSGDTGSLASEWSTSLTNRKITPNSPLTLSSVAAQDGDRIVIEIGARAHGASSGSGQQLELRIGDTGATDLPENETETNDYVPWIEFSNAITLANWTLVEDEIFDDDITYVYDTTTDDRDLYNIENLDSAWTEVKAVVLRARVRQEDPGGRKAALNIKSGGTESAGSDIIVGVSYGWITRIMDIDPTDSNSWSVTKVDNLQIGPKVR